MDNEVKNTPACGNKDCKISMFIDEESLTFGTGVLDAIGTWEKPCNTCARDWQKHHPDQKVLIDPEGS